MDPYIRAWETPSQGGGSMSVEAGGTWSYKIGFCDNQVGLATRNTEQSLFQDSGSQEASLGQETVVPRHRETSVLEGDQ